MMAKNGRLALALIVVCLSIAPACGGDVDLGGSADTGTPTNDGASLGRDGGDGGAACPGLSAPDAAASCRSCTSKWRQCQKNGCYDGYLCNTTTNDCQAPPAGCT